MNPLLSPDRLFEQRVKIVSMLTEPEKFAKKAYVVSTLGYIISTPFGFSDSSSSIPSEEEILAKELCEKSSTLQVVPYIYYLSLGKKYSLNSDLCTCLSFPVDHQLIGDPFTHDVLMGYLVDYVCRTNNYPENYRVYQIAYFCSGNGNILWDNPEPFPTMNEENLAKMIFSILHILDFLWEKIRFNAPIVFGDIIYSFSLFKISNFTSAEAIISTDSGLCLIAKDRKSMTEIFLEDYPYYYYSLKERMPGSFSLYSFIVSTLLVPEIREIFFSTSWGNDLWNEFFDSHDQRIMASRISSSLQEFNPSEIFSGIKLKCSVRF